MKNKVEIVVIEHCEATIKIIDISKIENLHFKKNGCGICLKINNTCMVNLFRVSGNKTAKSVVDSFELTFESLKFNEIIKLFYSLFVITLKKDTHMVNVNDYDFINMRGYDGYNEVLSKSHNFTLIPLNESFLSLIKIFESLEIIKDELCVHAVPSYEFHLDYVTRNISRMISPTFIDESDNYFNWKHESYSEF